MALMEIIKKHRGRIILGIIIFIVLLGTVLLLYWLRRDDIIEIVILPFYSFGLLGIGIASLFGWLSEEKSVKKIYTIIICILYILLPIAENILFLVEYVKRH
jgi:hypothetical protein